MLIRKTNNKTEINFKSIIIKEGQRKDSSLIGVAGGVLLLWAVVSAGVFYFITVPVKEKPFKEKMNDLIERKKQCEIEAKKLGEEIKNNIVKEGEILEEATQELSEKLIEYNTIIVENDIKLNSPLINVEIEDTLLLDPRLIVIFVGIILLFAIVLLGKSKKRNLRNDIVASISLGLIDKKPLKETFGRVKTL